MKTLTIFTVLLTLGISFSSFVVSRKVTAEGTTQQQNNTNPRVHRQGKGVSVSWSAPSNAVSFRVERAYNEPDFFETIYSGENTGDRSFKHLDQDVFPGDVFYRIVFIDANGNEEYSSATMIKLRVRG